MKPLAMTLAAAAILLLPTSSVLGQSASRSFAFNAASVSGISTGEVALAGGGSYSLGAGLAKAGGVFRCLADIDQGPLNGLKAGEGIRWDVAELLPSTTFKCSGGAVEKTASTDNKTVVIRAHFYRAEDGDAASFTATMIVSARDLDPDHRGTQNVWIQGVGCGNAIVSF